MSDEYVSREEWKLYIETGKIERNLPGIQGIGFSLIVPKEQLTRHIQEIRKEGFPDYKITPEGNREIYTSIIYIEPFTGKNLRAFGYDMYSEPERRAAMEQSRDSNTAMLSGKVKLVQEGGEEVQAGTLMYVPVYKKGMPVNTVEERRLAIIGWVYSPYRMNDLMLGILGGWDLQGENRIRLQIFDGDILTDATLMFDTQPKGGISAKEKIHQILPIDFNGKRWILNLSRVDAQSSYFSFVYIIVLISGIIISILIFFLIKSLLSTRFRAVEMAERLTIDIKGSEERNRFIITNSFESLYFYDNDSKRIVDANPAFLKLTGYTIEEARTLTLYDLVSEEQTSIDRNINKVLSGTGFSMGERRWKRKDGTIVLVEASASKFIQNGKTVIFISGRDISERKQTEKIIRDNEIYLKKTQKIANLGTYAMDLTSGKWSSSEILDDIFGIDSDFDKSIEGWNSVIHPEWQGIISEYFEQVIRDKEAKFDKEYKIIRWKDKTEHWVHDVGELRLNENGEPEEMIGIIQDITERRDMDERLFSQTALLEAQINSTIDGILIVDKNNNRALINNRLVELFNIPQHIMDDEDEAKMLQYVTGLTKNPEQFLEKVRHLYDNANETSRDELEFKNGMVFDRYSAPVLDKDGKNYGRIWTFRDITERKQADEILKKSEEKFKTFFDKSSNGIFLMDLNTKITIANEAFAQSHGYTVEEMQGMDISVIDIPDDSSQISERIERLLKGETLSFEVKHFHKLGNIIIQDVVTSMINIDNENYILAFHYDITIRKQAEEVLEKWNTQFQKLSSNAPGLIYQFTRRPDGTYYVPIASEGIMDIFGCTPEDVLEDFSPIARVIYPDDMERVIADIENSANNLTYFTCEFRVQIPGKEIQWVYSNSSPEKLPDGSITWYGFNTDITEQKQVQQELILAKEKAEESDRLKSAFLTNMSHEIRTPMNGILGFSELLKEPHLTGEEQEKFINIIEKSGRRMLNTINDIINISKIEAKQMNLLLSVTNIKDHIESIQIFFRSEAEKKGIQILIKENLPAKDSLVNTDSDKVYGILTNLVSNAIKFTKEGYVEIGCKIKENLLEFYVKDTGAGIEQDQKEIIFERFRQGSEGLSRGYEGSGLGLSISKAFVEILGGKIWVESEAGKGSTFYFTIPYSVENSSSFSHGGRSPRRICDTERAVDSVKLEPEIKKLKILIAEDDETSRMYISLIVKMYSKEILTAQNGIEAVDICRNNPDIDLIMMDIKMPEMDGDEATKQIRQFNKTVVIIAQTAFALKGDRERLIKSGCNDYMTKPVNRNLLGELIIKYFK